MKFLKRMLEIYVLTLAIVIDILFGEPRNKFHPVAWIGKIIEIIFFNSFINSQALKKHKTFKKIYGVIFPLILIIFFYFLIFNLLNFTYYFSEIFFIIVSAILFKITFSIRGMIEHANAVLKKLQNEDIEGARISVSMIVSRNTKNLNEKQIISATIESISENMVDGIISPIFYFTLIWIFTNSVALAVSSAFAFRIVNTLDSMIGYKNERFIDLGWFSARFDDVLNYIPARISILFFLNFNSIKFALKNHSKTPSPNSGWPISAMAKALNVSLEKPGFYVICGGNEILKREHISIALKIMIGAIAIFVLFNILLLSFFYILGSDKQVCCFKWKRIFI